MFEWIYRTMPKCMRVHAVQGPVLLCFLVFCLICVEYIRQILHYHLLFMRIIKRHLVQTELAVLDFFFHGAHY